MDSNAFDLSSTRCFIDADGTLFDSLPHYNSVFDTLFKGTLTERCYDDYRDEIDAIYDFIPGSPWHDIIAAGYEYLTGEKPGESLICSLESDFEDGAAAMFKTLSYDRLAIEPVIEFCRLYKERGGTIVIHSGTNEKILRAMLDSCGISDLFDDYLTSNMMMRSGVRAGELDSKWGYKTALLGRLLEKYPVNGTRDFVIGDTKGDAFGAKETGMPFLLVWRGYPKDPERLSANDARTEFMSPDAWVDARDDVIRSDRSAAEDVTGGMISFAEKIAAR